ncbi:MAG: signal peptide peptidase SppA [Bacteroidaceae bacterium]|nr:signal peptide peptidase SppA [Bacteroidaceae bacterium]
MKDFFKMFGATMLGLFVWTILLFIFTMIGIAGIVASESNTKVEEGTILRIKLSGQLAERAEGSPMAMLTGEEQSMGLDDILEAIDRASKNENIIGIYLEGGAISGSPAMLQEIRQAILRFKESKKFVVAYGDTYSQGSYYICSAADEVYMNPTGMLDWHGMSAEITFYTELMEKMGIKMQVYKVGTFKSAVEPYINTAMSEPNREQVNSYLTSIWGNTLKDVAASRKIKKERLNALADSMLMLKDPTFVLKEKMVDKLCYKDEVRDILKKKAGKEEDEKISFISPAKMNTTQLNLEKIEDCIAVYYAYGDIADDTTSGLTGGMVGSIVPEPMNKDLDKLMKDKSIKAVVIRVNSGGGSAYASEQIWRQISLLKAEKPVVISMGGLAASGGYYISCNASRIVAEPTTLTGSIGIFGMVPDASNLLTEKVGLHYDMVKTNEHADFGTMSRGMNDSEGALMQAYVERGYDLFTRRVAEGRHLTQDSVKAIAEGRVWTGEQALKLGLVDELGDLQVAIKAAAKLAKTTEYVTEQYPAKKSWLEKMMNENDLSGDYMEGQMKSMLGEYYDIFSEVKNIKHMNKVQAKMPYKLIINN